MNLATAARGPGRSPLDDDSWRLVSPVCPDADLSEWRSHPAGPSPRAPGNASWAHCSAAAQPTRAPHRPLSGGAGHSWSTVASRCHALPLCTWGSPCRDLRCRPQSRRLLPPRCLAATGCLEARAVIFYRRAAAAPSVCCSASSRSQSCTGRGSARPSRWPAGWCYPADATVESERRPCVPQDLQVVQSGVQGLPNRRVAARELDQSLMGS